MQDQSFPFRRLRKTTPYTQWVARYSKKPRPAQGARLLAFRKAAGLSQAELAQMINETQENISFWERSDKPPRSEVLPTMAKVLGVTIEELLGQKSKAPTAPPLTTGPGPVGQVQKAFEDVRSLPRNQQRKIVELVNALVTQFRNEAS